MLHFCSASQASKPRLTSRLNSGSPAGCGCAVSLMMAPGWREFGRTPAQFAQIAWSVGLVGQLEADAVDVKVGGARQRAAQRRARDRRIQRHLHSRTEQARIGQVYVELICHAIT